jgi:serine/threonine protein kinase
VKEIAATDGNVTQGDVLVGTPFFMAPETITEAGQAGPKSDIYSLGAVGYYLLAGRHVFEGESAVEICSAHLHDPPVPPSEKSGLPIPKDLEDLILQCLAKDPEDRPASASELQDLLSDCEAAGTWTQRDAREWWQEHASGFSGLEQEHEPMSQTDVLVDLDSRMLTRGPGMTA